MNKAFRPAAAAALALLACCSPATDEARIARLMNRVGTLAEKRDLPGLMSCLTEDYADFEGRDRPATETLVADHFRRRYGIVVHVLHARVGEVRMDGTASVQADVVLSSGAAEILRRVVRFAGEFYRFDLGLRKTPEGWKIARAEWAPASAEGLFPESLPVLRKLFPGAPESAPEP